ncbi:MAG: hypothetical protein KIT82_19865 [Bradyrhizobium sp.]|nr:hypothetical protein [Bradyrhizobium sp.]
MATIDAKAFLPVCMLMSRELTDKAVRIMPFDSGAFHHGRMHPPMHKEMALDEFEMAVDATAPMRLVDLFYGNERKYFDAAAKKEFGGYDEFEELEIDSYFRLLHHRSNSPTDDRVSAVEIQIADPIALAGQVHAVILPRQFLDRPGVVTQIESWGAIAIPYNVKEEFIPREAQGAIFEKIAEYLEQEGMLDPP